MCHRILDRPCCWKSATTMVSLSVSGLGDGTDSRLPPAPSRRMTIRPSSALLASFAGVAWHGRRRPRPLPIPRCGAALRRTSDGARQIRAGNRLALRFPFQPLQVSPHLRRGLITVLAVLLQRLADYPFQPGHGVRIQRRPELAPGAGWPANFARRWLPRKAALRSPSHTAPRRRRTGRCARPDPRPYLFRGHVGNRAQHGPGAGD